MRKDHCFPQAYASLNLRPQNHVNTVVSRNIRFLELRKCKYCFAPQAVLHSQVYGYDLAGISPATVITGVQKYGLM